MGVAASATMSVEALPTRSEGSGQMVSDKRCCGSARNGQSNLAAVQLQQEGRPSSHCQHYQSCLTGVFRQSARCAYLNMTSFALGAPGPRFMMDSSLSNACHPVVCKEAHRFQAIAVARKEVVEGKYGVKIYTTAFISNLVRPDGLRMWRASPKHSPKHGPRLRIHY